MTKATTNAVRTALLLIIVSLSLALAPAGKANAEARLDGVALYSTGAEDVLSLKVSEWRTPNIARYGNIRRIVLEFQDTNAAESVKRLLDGKRGCCVERYEVQMFRYAAEINPSGGVRKKLTKTTTLIVAYVEAGVEVKLNIIGNMVTATFFRIENSSPQERPAPVNEIEDVLFAKDDNAEYLLVKTSQLSPPDIRLAEDPERLLLTYLQSYSNSRVKNQVVRIMENANLFKLELLGLGTMPSPYNEYDDSGEYHFVGIPTPLAYNSFVERGYGHQYNDVVLAIEPKKDVEYQILRREGYSFEIAFVKKVNLKETYVVQEDESILPNVYELEDEHHRPIKYDY